jgi:predicted Holliday junction resolvase-like endonuclease
MGDKAGILLVLIFVLSVAVVVLGAKLSALRREVEEHYKLAGTRWERHKELDRKVTSEADIARAVARDTYNLKRDFELVCDYLNVEFTEDQRKIKLKD